MKKIDARISWKRNSPNLEDKINGRNHRLYALTWAQDKFVICQHPAHKARELLCKFVGQKVELGKTIKSRCLLERVKKG